MTRVFSIVVLIIVVVLLSMYYVVVNRDNSDKPEGERPAQQVESTQVEKKPFDYTLLRKDINELLVENQENYSIFVLKPALSDEPLVINNKVRRSASMIKVFIMAYVMDEAAHSKLNLGLPITMKASDKVGGAGIISGWRTGTEISIEELTRLMITESDNTATNMLIDYLGMDNINKYIQKNGYSETILQRKMMDLEAVAAGRENYSSVKDLGAFFSKLLNHSCVSYEYDQRMIDILLQQTDTEVFPAALSNASIAHKTGELNNLYDDGGIIFTDDGAYVVVIMNDDIVRREAVSTMKKILKAVNAYWTK